MRRKNRRLVRGVSMLALVAAAGCGKDNSPLSVPGNEHPGVVTLAAKSDLPVCKAGALGIVYYVSSTQEFYYCDGSANQVLDLQGLDGVAWVVTTALDATALCIYGGVVISAGPDANRDGVADSVTSSQVVCNGIPGRQGNPGAQGSNALASASPEPSGTNCANGGTRIDVGTDSNGNGILDPNEMSSTQYVCNGADGDRDANPLVVEVPSSPPFEYGSASPVMVAAVHNRGTVPILFRSPTFQFRDYDFRYNDYKYGWFTESRDGIVDGITYSRNPCDWRGALAAGASCDVVFRFVTNPPAASGVTVDTYLVVQGLPLDDSGIVRLGVVQTSQTILPCPSCPPGGYAGAPGIEGAAGTAGIGAGGSAGYAGQALGGNSATGGNSVTGGGSATAGAAGTGGGTIDPTTIPCSAATGPTYISGAITTNTAWCAQNSPIVLTGNVLVFPGVGLVVRDGVTVKSQPSVGIQVRGGSLFVQGSVDSPAVFTSNADTPNAGDWAGLSFTETSALQMDHGVVEYAASAISNAKGSVTNSTLRNNNYGLYNGSVTLSSSQIHDNASSGVYYGSGPITNCRIHHNQNGVVWYFGSIADSQFTHNTYWGISNTYSGVANCVISDNGNGVLLDHGASLRSSTVARNGIGVHVPWGDASLVNNTIASNQVGIRASGTVNGNNICYNSQRAVELATTSNVDLKNNYWCTMNDGDFPDIIWDAFDDINLGIAFYSPFLSAPVPEAPVIPSP